MAKVSTAKYDRERRELVAMVEQDQKELFAQNKKLALIKDESLKQVYIELTVLNCHKRTHKVLSILDKIKSPTVSNIGEDGIEAMQVIGLHSYIVAMRTILNVFEETYRLQPNNFVKKVIPSLKDRVMVIEKRKQLFGTYWFTDKDDNFFLIPVLDFSKVNILRAAYDKEPLTRPAIFDSSGKRIFPIGKGLANEKDQKIMTDEEYERFTKYSLKDFALKI